MSRGQLVTFGVAHGTSMAQLSAAMSGDPTGGGLATVARYMGRHPKSASLAPLSMAAAAVAEGANWRLVAPSADSPGGRLEAIHFLRVRSRADAMHLAAELRLDGRVSFVSQPALQHFGVEATTAFVHTDPEWGIKRCGFPDTWNVLDVGPTDPGPIGIIDTGGDEMLDKLAGRVTTIPVVDGPPSGADHAMEVAGVITARRDVAGLPRGCCSAQVDLYNVFSVSGPLDHVALCRALADAATRKLPVVNMSFSLAELTPCVRICIDSCVAQGVIVVAAMGDTGDLNALAAHPGVIAVGGTNLDDDADPARWRVGGEMFVAAPAMKIPSMSDPAHPNHGTSFAAPMVSAALWLARRKRPDLGAAEIVERLKQCVNVPNAPRTNELGFGRLDMRAMAGALTP